MSKSKSVEPEEIPQLLKELSGARDRMFTPDKLTQPEGRAEAFFYFVRYWSEQLPKIKRKTHRPTRMWWLDSMDEFIDTYSEWAGYLKQARELGLYDEQRR